MEAITQLRDFEDWQKIDCRGEFEVTSEKLIVQVFRGSCRIVLAAEAGKTGSRLTEYTVMFDEQKCELYNFMNQKYGCEDVMKLVAELEAIEWPKSDYQSKAKLDDLVVYKETVKGKDYRPSWWKPTGKKEKLSFEANNLKVEVLTNEFVKIYDPKSLMLMQCFRLGDTVEQGSYNLTYTGEIIDIKPKYVEIRGCPCGTERHTYDQFVRRNWDLDLDKISKHNANWSD